MKHGTVLRESAAFFLIVSHLGNLVIRVREVERGAGPCELSASELWI